MIVTRKTSTTTTHKPTLLNRIANSLRSLTTHHGSNTSNDKNHHHQTSAGSNSSTSHHHSHHHQQATQLHHTPITEQSDNEKLLAESSANTTITTEKPVGLDLMNVFIKPTDLLEKPVVESQVENVNEKEFFNYNEHDFQDSSDNSSNSSDDDYSPSGTPLRAHLMDTTLNEEAASSYLSSIKSSRYMSYRNSLTNSVKGSLMECSVPEDQEDEEEGDDDHNGNLNYSKSTPVRSHHLHHHHYRHGHGYTYHHHRKSTHHRLTNTPNTTVINNNNNNVNNVNNKIILYNERIRKFNTLSIIDTSSLVNLPLNTKTLYFNLNNSFIKKRNKMTSKNNNNSCAKTVNFLNYLKYLFDRNLFLNSLIFLINFTFSISLIGKF